MFRIKSSPDQGGKLSEPRPIEWKDVLPDSFEVRQFKVPHLSEKFTGGDKQLDNPLKRIVPDARALDQDWICQAFSTWGSEAPPDSMGKETLFQCMKAGQRNKIYWDPSQVNAAIVNCGGLCPGLNSVIREVTMMLKLYGVKTVYGIIGGYKGVMEPETWINLDPETVQDIHTKGGSFLVSDRGNPPHYRMAETFRDKDVRLVFIIGGDGTHKGATTIYEEAAGIEGLQTLPGKALNPPYECSVVGIPKTIDNDIALLDFTFGFHSAVAEAVRAIDAAYVESSGNANCLGLVKLMGRSSGFIAMTATLAARHVDLCLIPEMNIDMNKVLTYIEELQKSKHNAVVVIAEGLGDTLIKGEGVDAGGNKKLADVGPWFKKQVEAHFKAKDLPLSIKYIDPSYQVRAVPPDAFDSVYCSVLAQNAVHGAMAGYTGFTVGRIDENYVMLPIQAITQQKSKTVDVHGRGFARMVFTTNQPRMVPDEAEEGRAAGRTPAKPVSSRYLGDPLKISDVFMPDDIMTRYQLENLSTRQPGANIESPLCHPDGHHDLQIFKDGEAWSTNTVWKRAESGSASTGGWEQLQVKKVKTAGDNKSLCYWDPKNAAKAPSMTRNRIQLQLLRAGPRRTLYWDPKKVKAAIVNCGGICPGLNSVIREVVMMLNVYGCDDIHGIIGGYKGVMEPHKWIKLTPKVVEEWHLKGGSCLVSDRGNPLHIDMAKMYRDKGITHVYIIGGDGTHKGVMQTYEQMLNIGYVCSMCGIPKTIDNDIALLDFTFGFHTAVAKAVEAIDAAYVEATCNANCMGLVKLMGRHAGHIALYACNAARHVELCLIPEMEIDMDTVKDYIAKLMEEKGRCVVVIAEGLGDTLIKGEGADAGGNKALADVGPWFKKQVEAYMKALGKPFTCKYIDPSYLIRASPPDTFDSVYCSTLAQAAVHGCFAGYTGFTVGKVSNHYVMLPIDEITSRKSKQVTVGGHWYNRLLYTTQQPSMAAMSALSLRRPEDAGRLMSAPTEFAKLISPPGTQTNWFPKKDYSSKEAMAEVFKESGAFDKEKLKVILEGVGMSPESVEQVIKVTSDGNGAVNLEDFLSWIFEPDMA
jgi:6-phosphofructokinase 1